MRGKRTDLAQQIFGNLLVTPMARRNPRGEMEWLCMCTCRRYVWKTADNLRRGLVRSCSNAHRWSADPAE
jgi:hypothetical protein